MRKSLKITIQTLPSDRKPGRIIVENGRTFLTHELQTVQKLCQFGFDVTCRKESETRYIHTPDLYWQGKSWELKSTKAVSQNSIHNRLREAKQQAPNIIIDVSKSKTPIEQVAHRVQADFCRHSTIEQVLLIRHNSYCLITKPMLK